MPAILSNYWQTAGRLPCSMTMSPSDVDQWMEEIFMLKGDVLGVSKQVYS